MGLIGIAAVLDRADARLYEPRTWPAMVGGRVVKGIWSAGIACRIANVGAG
jgi:hypothetical protein